MTDTCTVEYAHLLELAAEVRGLREQLRNYCARSTYRERRLLELVATLARRLDPPELKGPIVDAPPGSLAELKARAIRQALEATGGNLRGAARILHVNVKTAYNLRKWAGLPNGYGKGRGALTLRG